MLYKTESLYEKIESAKVNVRFDACVVGRTLECFCLLGNHTHDCVHDLDKGNKQP